MPDTIPAHDADSDEIDAQLRLIAQALVDPALPPPSLDEPGFGAVVAQRDAARRRLTTAVAAAAAVVLLVTGMVVVAGGDWTDNADDPDSADVSSSDGVDPALAAPQRLVLTNWWGELPAGGEPVKLPLAGLDPHGRPRFLPDGDLVVVGTNPPPDPLPAGFDEMTDMTYGLAVIEPDGDVAVDREIAPAGLVGVVGNEALLERVVRSEPGEPRRIVAHDLATGAEQTVFEETGDPDDRSASSASAVIGDRLVTVGGPPMPPTDDRGFVIPTTRDDICTLSSLDLATGEAVRSDLDLACGMVIDVQPSPDGTQVALAYEAPLVTDPEVRLALVDVVTGQVVDDRLLGNNIECSGSCEPGLRPVSYLGMAWSDDATLEVALLDLVAAPDWNFDEDGLTTDDMVVDEISVG